ncbi:MAG: hypothetical protein J6K55_12300 [Clostridia bacterium]|nr:hypothetical protein [Clostridia bacterium]
MIRGTTPTLVFTLPFEAQQLEEAYISFAQNGKVVLEKTLSDCTSHQNTLTVRLTQEETLKLKTDVNTEIQIRARTIAEEAVASDIIRVPTGRILKDGVI